MHDLGTSIEVAAKSTVIEMLRLGVGLVHATKQGYYRVLNVDV
jgi:hypothetical protein